MKTYEIRDGNAETSIEADDMEAAKKEALDWLRDGDWGDITSTIWVDAHVAEMGPYTAEQLVDLDRAIDEFTDAFECWSINDIEQGTLNAPADDVPAPPAEAVAAARALHLLRTHMTGANDAAASRQETVTLTLHPDPPDCIDDEEHDWQSPHEIVGGIKENPGVWGSGGGVVIEACCMRCGAKKTTDTWTQRPDTGEQGLTSIAYEAECYIEAIQARE